jgi:hypothetical protein
MDVIMGSRGREERALDLSWAMVESAGPSRTETAETP